MELHDISGVEMTVALIPKSKQYLEILEDKLNRDLGFYYWKRYSAAAFWAQISMPINLVITMLTGLTTAQANSSNFISAEVYAQLTIVTLVFTILNTFFRPHAQMTANLDALQKWNAIGIEFEEVYYQGLDDDYNDPEVVKKNLDLYTGVQTKINDLREAEGLGVLNFATDLIHVIAYYTCCRRYQTWINKGRQVNTYN